MEILTLIVAVLALAASIFALITAAKKSETIKEVTKEIVKEVKVEHAPVEHPFTYDSERSCYTLDGNIEVTGFACLKTKVE